MALVVFLADGVTICRSTGYSPFSMAHGVEAVFPLDIGEDHLLPPLAMPASTESLIGNRAQQLLKHPQDLCDMAPRVLKAHKL